MKHMHKPLLRLLSEQPEPSPPSDDESGFADYYSSFPGDADPQGDEAWRDAVAEHAGMQVRFRR